jgi:hypothetical protein
MLYRELRITLAQLAAMIETGRGPLKKGVISGALGRSFSPCCRQCLDNVRTLHLTDFDDFYDFPTLPRGILFNIISLVIHHPADWYGYLTQLPMAFKSLPAAQLYIHYSEANIRKHALAAGVAQMPLNVQSVTLLLPSAHRLTSAPAYERWMSVRGGQRISPRLSVVLLPWRTVPGEACDHRATASAWSAVRSRTLPSSFTRFIGAEYIGTAPLDVRLLGVSKPQYGETTGTEGSATFTPFSQWLAEEGLDTVYSLEEEAGLRAADKELMVRPSRYPTSAVATGYGR